MGFAEDLEQLQAPQADDFTADLQQLTSSDFDADLLSLRTQPDPFEQAIIAGSPATLSREKPAFDDLLVRPTPPEPVLAPSPRLPVAGRGTGFDAPNPRRAAAGAVRGVGQGLDAIASTMQLVPGALQSAPMAAGEQFGGTVPSHAGEPETFFGRAAAHLGMTAKGRGADVALNPLATLVKGNPPDTYRPLTAADHAVAWKYGLDQAGMAHPGALERGVDELAQRGLATAATMMADPSVVAIGLAPASTAEALAVAYSAMGIKAAVETASSPQATPIDVAEAVVNAVLQTVPVAAHALPAVQARVGRMLQRGRVNAEPVAPIDVAAAPVESAQPSAPVASLPPEIAPEAIRALDEQLTAAATPPAPSKPPIDALLDNYIDKYAKGEQLGTPEARAAFAERTRVDDARNAAATEFETDLAAVSREPANSATIAEVPDVREPVVAGAIPPSGAGERAAAAAGGEVADAGAEASAGARRDRAAATDQAILDELVADARAGGFRGDDALLRGELDDRLQLLKELDAEFEASGHHPRTLLEAIAKGGGLGEDEQYAGELRWLKEHTTERGSHDTRDQAPFGSMVGVNGVFRKTGLTLDGMLEYLRQEPRFEHLETIDDLIDEIRTAAMAERPLAAAHRLRKGLGEKWWETIDAGDVSFEPEAEPLGMAGKKRDTSTASLFGERVDTLDTGEQQPRLPGAEEARKVGVAETTMRAPVQASGDDFSLEAPPTAEARARDAKAAKGASLFGDEDLLARPTSRYSGAWDRPPRGMPKSDQETPAPPKTRPPAETRKPSLFDQKKPSLDGVLSRPLGSTRADPSGALVPAPGARAIAAIRGDKQLRPSEIVKTIQRSLDDLPVRIGVGRHQALGYWMPKWETIHLKVANDLDTFAHELGHHIHETVVGDRVPYGLYRDELLALGAPTSRGSYSVKQRLQEGQAEFTRYWLSDPATAQKLAPDYFKAFEAGLEQLPALQAVLQRAQRQYRGHLTADPVARGVARIDFDGVQGGTKGDVVTRLEAAWVDDLAPLRRAVDAMADGEPIDSLENAYEIARRARGAASKADGFLRHGVRDIDGTFVAGALEPALKPVRARMTEFAAYLVASRVPELRARGMETAMSAQEARAIRDKLKSPEFDEARKAVYDYQDGLLTYAKRSRLLSGKQIAAMKELNRFYVPFQRVMDQIGEAAEHGTRSGQQQRSPIKRIKGSGRDIINPIESIVRNTHTFVALVEENRARLALVDQAKQAKGAGRFLEPATEKMIATTFNLVKLEKQIRQILEDAGVDLPMSNRNLFDEMVTIFTPTQFKLGDKGIISVIRNGEREYFSVNEPALYDAITAVVPKQSDLLVNLFMRPARALRAGATTTLGFIARNPVRDTLEAAVNSRYGFRPGYDTLRGLFGYLKKDEDYQRFLNAGGGSAAMVAGDRNKVREAVKALNLQAKRKIVDSVVFHPIDVLRALSEAMEQATRLGEFKRGYEHEQLAGVGKGEAAARAALAARDVTIDFSRGGSMSKEINKYTAFFNANVQGKARIAEVFKRNPIGATFRAVTALTLPSMALWYLNHDDAEYRELPEWERNTYWHIPVGRGAGHGWVRVPKPFDLGHVFGNLAEAALDFVTKEDPQAVARVFPDKDTAWRQLLAIVPSFLMPIVESATNYDTFRQRAIVSPFDLDLDPELQYNRWTSETAKFVGPKIGLAPAKLDHLIYGYGAGLARGVVQAADPVFGGRTKPSSGPAGVPGVGAFYRDAPRNDAESLQRFYQLRDAVKGAEGSVRRYLEAGDLGKADARRAEARKQFGDIDTTIARVNAADKELKQVRDRVNAVFASSTLSPTDKRTQLDALYGRMLDLARAGLGKAAMPKPKPQTAQTAQPAAR